MVKAGRARLAETLQLVGEGAPREVRLAERGAYDPQNARLHD
jgi:hypothetical protein